MIFYDDAGTSDLDVPLPPTLRRPHEGVLSLSLECSALAKSHMDLSDYEPDLGGAEVPDDWRCHVSASIRHHDAAAVERKLRWAESLYESFRRDRVSHFRTQPVYLERVHCAESSVDFVVRGVGSPPVDWSPRIGDILANLRSSLDHAAWLLAGSHASRQTSFLIVSEADEFARRAPRALAGIGEAARAVIERFQPYHPPAPHTPERTRTREEQFWVEIRWGLDVLHDLNNIGKHRELHVLWTAAHLRAATKYVDVEWTWGELGVPVADGDVLVTASGPGVTRQKLEPKLNIELSIEQERGLVSAPYVLTHALRSTQHALTELLGIRPRTAAANGALQFVEIR